MNTSSMLSVYSRGIRRNDSTFNSAYQAQEIYRQKQLRDERIRDAAEERQRQQELAREAARRREEEAAATRRQERSDRSGGLLGSRSPVGSSRNSRLDASRVRAWIEEWRSSSLNRFAHQLSGSSVLALLR